MLATFVALAVAAGLPEQRRLALLERQVDTARATLLADATGPNDVDESDVDEADVSAMGSACSKMHGAYKTRTHRPGRFKNKCATCKASCVAWNHCRKRSKGKKWCQFEGKKCDRYTFFCKKLFEKKVCAIEI